PGAVRARHRRLSALGAQSFALRRVAIARRRRRGGGLAIRARRRRPPPLSKSLAAARERCADPRAVAAVRRPRARRAGPLPRRARLSARGGDRQNSGAFRTRNARHAGTIRYGTLNTTTINKSARSRSPA